MLVIAIRTPTQMLRSAKRWAWIYHGSLLNHFWAVFVLLLERRLHERVLEAKDANHARHFWCEQRWRDILRWLPGFVGKVRQFGTFVAGRARRFQRRFESEFGLRKSRDLNKLLIYFSHRGSQILAKWRRTISWPSSNIWLRCITWWLTNTWRKKFTNSFPTCSKALTKITPGRFPSKSLSSSSSASD